MQGEAIYKGATRPAMKLGIPLVPLVVLFGTGMLLIMWGGTLVSWWIALGVVVAFVPALLWMRFVTSQGRPALPADVRRHEAAPARPQPPLLARAQLRAHPLPGSPRCLACLRPAAPTRGRAAAASGPGTGRRPRRRTRSPASSRSRRWSARTT
ncbi:MAG: VirB3 family type IV secretion system protein [Comamonadaceae bacterium]|nr:VirB3 family type IV secretion system protein [Comamonadaceae bacterium]